MPLPDEVRNLLEFSIELLVIGGGLPSLFLQRPAWLRELRQRYSFWRIMPIINRIDALSGVPPALGGVVLFHLCIAAGWCPLPETFIRAAFYGSLIFAFFLVAALWYQVRMTAFSQATQRIFWLAWYLFNRENTSVAASHNFTNGRTANRGDVHPISSFKKTNLTPRIPGGWNKFIARIQNRIVFAKSTKWPLKVFRAKRKDTLQQIQKEWRNKVIRDLGRLGTNTRTPQETILILQALADLAHIIPVVTPGQDGPLAQLTEATSRTLWPLEASDQEAFERAIQVFKNVLERWVAEKVKLRETADELKSGLMAESPILPHLYLLGREILNHFPQLLQQHYLELFAPLDDVRDNNSEASLLFHLGLQAAANEQWEPLLYILEKLREYALCAPNQDPEGERHPACSIPNEAKTTDDSLNWIEQCEPTLWFLGLTAYLAHHVPASWPWLRKYLIRLWPWEKDDTAQQELQCALQLAQRFFTTLVFQPETAHAVACLAQRLFSDEASSQEAWYPDCGPTSNDTTPAREADRGGANAA